VPVSSSTSERYARHLVIPEVGLLGQQKLAAARVLLVGLGGLGSPAALYLAAAGVGTLGLLDDDRVERSNLQRQVLYGEGDLGRRKVEAAAARLADLNPLVSLALHPTRLTAENAEALVAEYDVVVDGSDNFATRYLVNDACVLQRRPDVYGSVLRFGGQLAVFALPGGPCYRCLHPAPPPPGLVASCAEAGVLGVMPGIVGSLQAMETIKLILGIGEPLAGRLLLLDALGGALRTVTVRPDPHCPRCGPAAGGHGLVAESEAACAPAAGPPGGAREPTQQPGLEVAVEKETKTAATDAAAAAAAVPFEIDVHELASWREAARPHQLVDVRTPHEASLASLAGARLIPLQELPRRLAELDREAELVVYCHHGGRSAQATAYLRHHGFARARNLVGGIDAWAVEIDPTLPRY
jgi:molybdopterin/thiamine biosynthesis adenylyltransferase/rhodanese-related sulfurtransferase